MPVPLVDISSINIGIPDEQLAQTDLESVAMLIKSAFSEWGFVYFSGHGISNEEIEKIFKVSKEFFDLPNHIKEEHKRGLLGEDTNSGFTSIGMEKFVEGAPYDVKEAFDYGVEVPEEPKELWPALLPSFESEMKRFLFLCVSLAKRILHVIGVACQLKDPLYFVKEHKHIGSLGNMSALRTLYYPPIESKAEVKPGQLRCSEHTDYGSITLLFQDDAGGLMVKSRNGTYIPATPVKGAVLVNIADLMQRWTNDELISVQHKVIIPEDEIRRKRCRQSLAFFVQPDDASDIVCINGSNKYPVVNSKEYLLSRFRDTYE